MADADAITIDLDDYELECVEGVKVANTMVIIRIEGCIQQAITEAETQQNDSKK